MALLRTVFMGTAELACASLNALCGDIAVELAAVVTQPDRPAGRELKSQFSAVKKLALERNLTVLQPERARNPAFIEQLGALKPELIVVVAYGQILPQTILDLPRFGALNVHTSLLPKYRGAAPIQWAILNDESETGVTIMKMDAGLDTGPMLTRVTTPIAPADNAHILHDRLASLGAELLVKTIPDYVAGRIVPQPQPLAGASYARKITKQDGQLDWTQPARLIWNRVRGLIPWPGAFTFQSTSSNRRLLKIWEAEIDSGISGEPGEVVSADKRGLGVACGDGGVRLLGLQREGGRKMTAQEFLAGAPIKAGERLG
jgi:methionyl-tRNA formyltransferase